MCQLKQNINKLVILRINLYALRFMTDQFLVKFTLVNCLIDLAILQFLEVRISNQIDFTVIKSN